MINYYYWLLLTIDYYIHIKKQGFTLSRKVHLVKAMVFPVVIYGCKFWNIKTAEH